MDSGAPTTPPTGSLTDSELLRHYRELRDLARQLLVHERRGDSLQPTDLAHEAWLRVADRPELQALSPDEFRRHATLVMRHVLVDRARARRTEKRGGRLGKVNLDALELAATGGFDDLLAIDEAIEKLAARDAALAELVRLRFFAGLSIEETAQALGASTRTVNRDWNLAKALLAHVLKDER